jgi:hypothetical protein
MHPNTHSHVLQLDLQGTPQAWISLEQAAVNVATGSVAWVDGAGPLAVLRGGFNVARGCQSVIEVHPIIALAGASKRNLFDIVPAFAKAKLFRRDRFTCAYCGQRFAERELSCDHVVPQSRGGAWTWMNLVTAWRVQWPQGRPHAGGSAHASVVPALRAQPLRGVPARRPAHPSRRA